MFDDGPRSNYADKSVNVCTNKFVVCCHRHPVVTVVSNTDGGRLNDGVMKKVNIVFK